MWHRCPPYSDPSWPACCTLTMASVFSALQARLWDISELPCSPSSETLTGCLHLCMDCCPLSNFSSLIWSPIGPVLVLSYRRLTWNPPGDLLSLWHLLHCICFIICHLCSRTTLLPEMHHVDYCVSKTVHGHTHSMHFIQFSSVQSLSRVWLFAIL